MTPGALAALHDRAFAPARGWKASEFASLLASRHVRLYALPEGFVLLRVVADEVEILTLAVDPAARRRGVADRLMEIWMQDVDARIAHLEVAADNSAALSLYEKHGFDRSGLRKAYYVRPGNAAVDAVLMQSTLNGTSLGETPACA